MLPITLYTKTDIGMERETNEDSVASLTLNSKSFRNEVNYGILVVADGMGGHDLGEAASEIAARKFVEHIVQSIFIKADTSEKISFEDILYNAVEIANKEVWSLSEDRQNRIGTTLVGAIVANNNIYVANVGDSRAYLIKPNKSIQQITKDHSVVQEMLDNNVITKQQAINHPRRNMLTKALGLTKMISPDIFTMKIEDEILMLCSDGLYSMIDEKEITTSVNDNIYETADELISLANKYGGEDNISIAIAKYSHDKVKTILK